MYGKVFVSMYDGTLASKGPWQALVTFQQMIVLADQDGVVDMTADAISRRTSIPLDIIETGIEALMQPDRKSRTEGDEGRRIVYLESHRNWGWQIVNHAKYRAIKNAEERREYLRVAQANRRERLKTVNNVNTLSTKSTHTEADAHAEAPAEAEFISQPSTVAPSGKTPRKRVVKPDAASASTFEAYKTAYKERYGVDPLRNAKVNAQLAQLVQRLGIDEAPGVARSYLANRSSLYVSAKHCTDLLLRDAEKLRTEWVTGQVTHSRDAHEEDRVSSTGAMWDRISDRLTEKGILK